MDAAPLRSAALAACVLATACAVPPRTAAPGDVRGAAVAWEAFRAVVVARDWDGAWAYVSRRARAEEFADDSGVFRRWAEGTGAPLLAEVAAGRRPIFDATGDLAYADLPGPRLVGVGLRREALPGRWPTREGRVRAWRVDDLVRAEEATP